MKSFHFDVGNSSVGHIGLSARIKAETAEAALEILKDHLPDTVEVPIPDEGKEEVEYINVYLNGDAFKLTDIDASEEVDEDDEDGDGEKC